MRDELIAYLKLQDFGTVQISEEVPYTKDGEPLYLKNYKRIYVDRDQTLQEPLLNTLDGGSVVLQTTTVVAYLTIDARTPLVNYETIVSNLMTARNLVAIDTKMDRTVSVAKSYQGEGLVTEFTYEFKEVITQ